jgi:hypothetical protein
MGDISSPSLLLICLPCWVSWLRRQEIGICKVSGCLTARTSVQQQRCRTGRPGIGSCDPSGCRCARCGRASLRTSRRGWPRTLTSWMTSALAHSHMCAPKRSSPVWDVASTFSPRLPTVAGLPSRTSTAASTMTISPVAWHTRSAMMRVPWSSSPKSTDRSSWPSLTISIMPRKHWGDEQGIAVFLVALTVERIDDAYVPRFAVLSQPNAWRAVLAAQDSARFASLEDFLAACEEGVRPTAQQVVRDWLEAAGSVSAWTRPDLAGLTWTGGCRAGLFLYRKR